MEKNLVECWINTSAPQDIGIYYNINGKRTIVHMTGPGSLLSSVKTKKSIGYGYLDDPDFDKPHDFRFCWWSSNDYSSTHEYSIYNINGREVYVNFASYNTIDDPYDITDKVYVGFGYFLRRIKN